MKLKLTPSVKQKLRTRMMMALGMSFAITLFVAGVFFFINISKSERTKASGTGYGGNGLNSGEIISQFLWNDNPVTTATIGPNAIAVSRYAKSVAGGRYNSNGLSAGLPGADINLVLAGSKNFDLEGIDISIDFKRQESSGNFFTRGDVFNFGFIKGYLTVTYNIAKGESGFITFTTVTDYEIPMDDLFRNYRFIYTPSSGRGEIFVNSVPVWSKNGPPNTKLYWKNAGNIIIAEGIDGSGNGKAILDNLVIRSTGVTASSVESLLRFEAEPKGTAVALSWTTAIEAADDFFTIERSINGVDFTRIGIQRGNGSLESATDYLFTDLKPVNGITYYRISKVQKNGQFHVYTPVALMLKNVPGSFSIDKIGELPFRETLDIAYYVPASGKIILTLVNTDGKVCCSESFEAQQGSNVHVFSDTYHLDTGTYNLNLAFGKTILSKKIMKA